jgi:hypothetical protein
MNRLIVLIYVCFIVLSFTFAQADSTKQYLLTTSTENISLTSVDLLDPYLSPLVYTGVGVGYLHSDMKYFKKYVGKMSHESRFSILAANTYNPQYSSSMNYVGGQYQWGMHYHFRPLDGLRLLVGGNTGLLMAVKSNERNVNNPVNVDAALDLGFSGIANYDFSLWRKRFTLSFQLEFPLLGMMYVPMQGASYYEMFTGGDLSNTLHLSSLHNRLARTSGLKLEIPAKNSTWYVGVSTSKLKYEANDMFFKQNNYNFNVGYAYDLYIFRGRKNLPPANFISVKQ